MTRRLTRTGEGRLGCFLWMSLVALFALVAWKVVPIRIKSSELSSYMEEQAKFASRASPVRTRWSRLRPTTQTLECL